MRRPPLGVFLRRLPAGHRPKEHAAELRRRGVRIAAFLGPWHDRHGYRDPVPSAREEALAKACREIGIRVWVYGWPRWTKEEPEGGLGRWCADMADHCSRLGAELALVDLEDASLVGSAVDDVRVGRLFDLLADRLASAQLKGLPIGVTYFHPPDSAGVRVALARAYLQVLQTYKGPPDRARARLEAARSIAPQCRVYAAPPAFGENSGEKLAPYLDGILEASPEGLIVWSETQIDEREWEILQRVSA